MAYYMTDEQHRQCRINWNLELIARIDYSESVWCKNEARRLFNQFVNNGWTDDDGNVISYESWLDTIAETKRIELENWQARRCAEMDNE